MEKSLLGVFDVEPLDEMLEGQVAVLASGKLEDSESLELLQALRTSPLYRADQHSYILYPDRDLAGFLKKNVVPAKGKEIALLAALLEAGDQRIAVEPGEPHVDVGVLEFFEQRDDLLGAGDVEVGDELPYIPEHQLRATAGLEASKWRFNIAANYVGKLRTHAGQGSFIPEESIDSHVVWDMVAAWQFTPQLSTYVKVDNLFDETYIAARRPAGVRPGLPRTAYLGLTYRL